MKKIINKDNIIKSIKEINKLSGNTHTKFKNLIEEFK
jgi:hypothetical protein